MQCHLTRLRWKKQVILIFQSSKDENLAKGWFPTLDANGSLVYNSSVIDMSGVLGSLPIPGIARCNQTSSP